MWTVQGAGPDELVALGRALKASGDRELRKEALRSLRSHAKPVGAEAKKRAVDVLPRRGGLGAYVARTRVALRNKMSGHSAGIRLVGGLKKGGGLVDLPAIDDGRLRHPVFAREHPERGRKGWRWVQQRVPRGWWSKTMRRHAPKLRRALTKDVHKYLKRAAGA